MKFPPKDQKCLIPKTFRGAGFPIGKVGNLRASAQRPMKILAPVFLLLLLALAAPAARGERIEIAGRDCLVVLPAETNAVTETAARELQQHLRLVTGQPVAVTNAAAAGAGSGYPFFLGVPAPGDARPLAPEEARWEITPRGAWLWGNDGRGRSGTQDAVYGFLEEELGVRWIEPGDFGVVAPTQASLTLTAGRRRWVPEMKLRKIRLRDRPMAALPTLNITGDLALFDGFRRSLEEQNQDAHEGRLWQQRMRMGGVDYPNYGHAFTKWWDRFHATHPDYFALTHLGKREPTPDPRPVEARTADAPFTVRERSFVKLCVSNPKVVEQILQDWRPKAAATRFLNACENDMPYGFCRCANCRQLDAPKTGERFGAHLTDRYVWFANQTARAARKLRPDAVVTMYAYAHAEQPPRREKLDPNVVIAVAPTAFDLRELARWFDEWRAAGATAMVIRPNLHWYYATLPLPLGHEKQMFDVFQLAVKHGCVAADFDSIKRNWPTTGLFNYVLAKTMSDPSQPFERWEEQYLSAFGSAAEDVKAYHRYWRNELWEKRLAPSLEKLAPSARPNFCAALLRRLNEFYREEDFDRTDACLRAAAQRTLEPPEKARVARLALANQHARLVFRAATTPMPDKLAHARKLLEFRRQQGNRFGVTWIDLIGVELGKGEDLCGLAAAMKNPAP